MTQDALYANIIRKAREQLECSGVWDVEADLQALIDRFLHRSSQGRMFEEFEGGVYERCLRVPLGHITGRVDFGGVSLVVGTGVFVPRLQSLIILKWLKSRSCIPSESIVMDICSGCGAIGLALAKQRPDLKVFCVEPDDVGYAYLVRNANRLALNDIKVASIQADVLVDDLSSFYGKVGLVVANPPYVPLKDELMPEWGVHHPSEAIYAGNDGFDVVRGLVWRSLELLSRGGWLIVEHAESQAPDIRHLFSMAGYLEVETLEDSEFADSTGASVATVGRKP
jgi:release factor glutamine methyltransferase